MEDDTDSVSEELYSKRGTQSGIVSEMSRRMLSLDTKDPDSSFLVETFSSKWGDKYFELRPSAAVA
jgi:hypothetical protein